MQDADLLMGREENLMNGLMLKPKRTVTVGGGCRLGLK